MPLLGRPRRRHVVHHDATVAHRRLYGNRVPGPRVHVLAGAAVNDALRRRLRADIRTPNDDAEMRQNSTC